LIFYNTDNEKFYQGHQFLLKMALPVRKEKSYEFVALVSISLFNEVL
jgi:hypothetical protein